MKQVWMLPVAIACTGILAGGVGLQMRSEQRREQAKVQHHEMTVALIKAQTRCLHHSNEYGWVPDSCIFHRLKQQTHWIDELYEGNLGCADEYNKVEQILECRDRRLNG